MLRPLIEFCSPVYHSLLSEEQSMRLEGLQKMALQIILGFGLNYCGLLDKANLKTLKERRELAFLNFAKSLVKNPRYNKWFPLNNERNLNLRSERLYKEEHSKTTRLFNSPLFSMRRALNEEEHVQKTQENTKN